VFEVTNAHYNYKQRTILINRYDIDIPTNIRHRPIGDNVLQLLFDIGGIHQVPSVWQSLGLRFLFKRIFAHT
jgi:hypothetical protein